MCNQRDRLIGYLYNEGSAAERDEVQRHLDTCAECRTEIAGLRSVREDLLAWEIPDHESVWRPFAPAPVAPWWRQVPAWAMAAAAGVVIVSGAAGGAVVHAFLPEPVQTVVGPSNVVSAPVKVGVSESDLLASQTRALAQLQRQVGALDARVQRVSAQPRPVQTSEVNHDTLVAELVELREQLQQQLDLMAGMYANFDQQVVKKYDFRNAAFENRLKNLESLAQLQIR